MVPTVALVDEELARLRAVRLALTGEISHAMSRLCDVDQTTDELLEVRSRLANAV